MSRTAREQDSSRYLPQEGKISGRARPSSWGRCRNSRSLRSLGGCRRRAFSDFAAFFLAFSVILLVMAGVTYIVFTSGPFTVVTPLPSTTSTSSASSGPSTTTSSGSTSASPQTTSITIPKGSGSGPSGAPGYAPDKVTVVIGVNNTVTWTNDDIVAHTVTSVSGNGTVSSGNMAPNATFTYTFSSAGTYDYYCEYHSWMSGTIVVKSG